MLEQETKKTELRKWQCRKCDYNFWADDAYRQNPLYCPRCKNTGCEIDNHDDQADKYLPKFNKSIITVTIEIDD